MSKSINSRFDSFRALIFNCRNEEIAAHLATQGVDAEFLNESGTDLRYIQELLGHNSSKTTETCLPVGKVYSHVITKSVQKIKSPFDDL